MPKTKQIKQIEATDRQRLRNARTNVQQVELLVHRPGMAWKEMTRLVNGVVEQAAK